ncbi:MAG: hypothetical protein ACYC40_04580 [Patescibacteria group bacterium]
MAELCYKYKIKMLLVETEKCKDCKYFEEGDELCKCNSENITSEFPDGIFNHYYADILNCKCECQFFEEK